MDKDKAREIIKAGGGTDITIGADAIRYNLPLQVRGATYAERITHKLAKLAADGGETLTPACLPLPKFYEVHVAVNKAK